MVHFLLTKIDLLTNHYSSSVRLFLNTYLLATSLHVGGLMII